MTVITVPLNTLITTVITATMTIDNFKKLFVKEVGLVPNPSERLDLRPEEDIRAQINSYIPVESERNIWAYWDTGFDSMPPWRQRNIIDWIRRNGKSWVVRVLDKVPGSPNHVHRFIDAAYLPIAFNEDRMKGHHSGQNISDFLRLATLYQVCKFDSIHIHFRPIFNKSR
jgi:hypothetical protein